MWNERSTWAIVEFMKGKFLFSHHFHTTTTPIPTQQGQIFETRNEKDNSMGCVVMPWHWLQIHAFPTPFWRMHTCVKIIRQPSTCGGVFFAAGSFINLLFLEKQQSGIYLPFHYRSRGRMLLRQNGSHSCSGFDQKGTRRSEKPVRGRQKRDPDFSRTVGFET